jgi:hypothetical protein
MNVAEATRLRALWRAHCDAHDAVSAAWKARAYSHPPPAFPQFPSELAGLSCGAKTRAGTPCKRTDIFRNGRCKLHGGLSTGPTTAEGKSRTALNGKARQKKQTP